MRKKQKNKGIIAIAAVMLLMPLALLAADYPNLLPPNLQKGPAASPPAPAHVPPSAQTGDTARPPVPAKPPPVVTISARVESPEVPLNETIKYVVILTWQEPADEPSLPLDFEFPEPPSGDGLVLIGNSFKSETELSGDKVKVERVYTYEFHARQIMSTQIKPVKINYYRIGAEQKAELSTQAIPVNVIKARVKPGQTLRSPAAKVALVVLIIGAAALVGRTWRKARKPVKEEAEPLRTRHEIARDRLMEADRLRMAGDYKAFMQAVSGEIRSYVQDVIDIKARGMSGEDLSRAVADKMGEEWRERIGNFEKLCAEVKFAGYEPKSGEMDMVMQTAKRLVDEGERLSEDVPVQK